MRYGEMTWPELDMAVRDRVVMVPLGSTEQHGQHLPVLTDTYLVTSVAEYAEAHLADDVLLTPTLWIGASDHHLDFPGTVSLPNALYSEVVKSVVRSLVRSGAGRILLLNGHGGNRVPADQGLTELSNEDDVFDRAWIVSATYWNLAAEAMKPERHGMTQPAILHACEYETSMMLHLHNDLVHLDRAVESDPPMESRYWGEGSQWLVSAYKRFSRQTGPGSLGRPTLATPAKGESLVQAAGEQMVAFVREFKGWPVLKKLKE